MSFEKLRATRDRLMDLMWRDEEVSHLFRCAEFVARNQTKHLDQWDVEYIVDGLDHLGNFRQPWEGREEFTYRFLDRLIKRGEARFLFGAAIEAAMRGADWNYKPEMLARMSLNEWLEQQRTTKEDDV